MIVRDAMQTEVVTIQAGQTVPDAVVMLGKLEAKRLLVLDGKRLMGLLTSREITQTLQKSSGPQTPWGIVFQAASTHVRDIVTHEVFTALETDDLKVAIQSLLDHHVGELPVLDAEGALSGLLTLTDVLRTAAQDPQPGWGLVRDHMSTGALSVTPETSLSEAAAYLTVTRLRVLPVVAGAGHEPFSAGRRRLLGVLHQRDIRAAITHAEDGHGPTVLGDRFFLGGLTARDMMRPPTNKVLADAEVMEAVRAMLMADVHGLPVIDDDEDLLGVITVSDILRLMVGGTFSSARVPAISALAQVETHG
ncbi:CBS domain-containing protein [Deinococcus sp. UYEF24]